MRAILLLAFLALVGCARTESYQVVIQSGDFTREQEGQIVQAMEAWESAVPVTFRVHVDGCPDPLWNTVCVRSVTTIAEPSGAKAYGRTDMHDELDYSSFVNIAADTPPDLFVKVVTHEMGHAQGLVHHGAGTLMYATTNADQAAAPTPDDVAQWETYRR